ncbi:MAG: transposase [Candidatus Omnitrophota bacterium]
MSISLKKRIIFEGAIYHVIQRAPGNEVIFLEDGDYLYFLKILKKTVLEFDLELFAFALLPNHIHILLQIKKTNLSLAMKKLFERYAQYFNIKYQRKGHVFCGRFRASLCQDDTYFLTVSAYIHLNPYRAGLCQDFENYKWSSIHLFMSDTKSTFVNPEKILSLLNEDQGAAKQQYKNMLSRQAALKNSRRSDISSIKRILGSDLRTTKEFLFGKQQEDLDQLIERFKQKRRMRGDEDKNVRKYVITQLLANGYLPNEIQSHLGINRVTYYRIVRS